MEILGAKSGSCREADPEDFFFFALVLHPGHYEKSNISLVLRGLLPSTDVSEIRNAAPQDGCRLLYQIRGRIWDADRIHWK